MITIEIHNLIGAQIERQIWEQVSLQLCGQIIEEVEILDQIRNTIRDQTRDQVFNLVEFKTWASIMDLNKTKTHA